jgi:hypothetical protein
MPTKKRVAPRTTAKTTPKRPAQPQDRRLQVLTFSFTVLCIVFAAVAFWHYG